MGGMEKTLDGVRVLVAEDDEDMRALLEAVLEMAGAVVCPVGSVVEASAALGANAFDVLVSDVRMLGGAGTELARDLKEGVYGVPIPAVALSGFGSMRDLGAASNAGFDAQLAKPVDNDELVETVARVVRGARRAA